MPATPLADIEGWPPAIGPAYAMDDRTAIRVVNSSIEIISEGHWKLFTARTEAI